MSKFTALKTRLKKFTPAAVGFGLVSLAGTASADIAADISSAVTVGQSNVTLVAAGLVAMAAVMAGIGLVISALKR